MSNWMKESAEEVNPNIGSGPLPVADYGLKIVGAEEKATKDGTGVKVNVEFRVVGGDYDGRKIFENYNVVNKSEKAQEIGRKGWEELCLSAGFLAEKHATPAQLQMFASGVLVKKTDDFKVSDLVGKVVMARTKIEKDNRSGKEYAKVASTKPLDVTQYGDEMKAATQLPI